MGAGQVSKPEGFGDFAAARSAALLRSAWLLTGDEATANDLVRAAVVSRALQTLPPQQRAMVVLRFFDDLTEAQAADVLGCSVGTVKSQTAKALSRLHGRLQWPGGS